MTEQELELTPYYQNHKEKMIDYQKKYHKMTNYSYDKKPERYEKQRIRWAIRNLFRRGKIKKEKCELCSSKNNLQFHHYDYNNAYDFKVLCKECHLKEHKKIGYKLPLKCKEGKIR